MELSTIVKNTDLNILYIDITKTAGMAITESLQVQFPNYTFEGKHHSIQNFIAHGSDIVDDFGRRLVGTCRHLQALVGTCRHLQGGYSARFRGPAYF